MKMILVVVLIVLAFSFVLWFVLSKIYDFLRKREIVEKADKIEKEQITNDKLSIEILKQSVKNKRDRIKVLSSSLSHRAEIREIELEIQEIEHLISNLDEENVDGR